MTIWQKGKKHKTEESSLNLNKDRSGRRKTERSQENINLLHKILSRIREHQPERTVWILVRVDVTESLSAI